MSIQPKLEYLNLRENIPSVIVAHHKSKNGKHNYYVKNVQPKLPLEIQRHKYLMVDCMNRSSIRKLKTIDNIDFSTYRGVLFALRPPSRCILKMLNSGLHTIFLKKWTHYGPVRLFIRHYSLKHHIIMQFNYFLRAAVLVATVNKSCVCYGIGNQTPKDHHLH